MSRNQRSALLVVVVVVVVAAFVVLRSGGGSDTAPPTTGAPRTVVVRNGQAVGGVQKLTFAKGSTIAFKVRSDTPGEIHFHGYDVHREIPKGGGTVSFDVPAKSDGRYVVELEASGQQIAEVEVTP